MTTKIIDGKRYNTETATLVAEWSNGLSYSDFGHCEEDLYRTAKGAWFLVGAGGPRSRYARHFGNESRGSSNVFRVLTPDEAREFLEKHGETEALETYFAGEISDA